MMALRLLIAVAGCAYVFGVWQQARRDQFWPHYRTILFMSGIALIELGLSPIVMHLAHHDLRAHMIQHLMIGMYAPVALVFACPMTLLLKSLPTQGGRRLVAFLGHPIVRLWSHPITSVIFNIGGMAALYLTGLYMAQLHSPALALLVHFHFIAAGCLFTWAVAGPDPAPHRPALLTRLIVLVIAMACHAVLGKWMYFIQAPAVPGATVQDITQAAQWMFYGGELAEAVLVFVLVRQWLARERPTDTALSSCTGS